MAETNPTTDKRAAILLYLDEHRGYVASQCRGACWGGIVAALRAEVERHEQVSEWREPQDISRGAKLGCCCQDRASWPCSTLNRIYASLGLDPLQEERNHEARNA